MNDRDWDGKKKVRKMREGEWGKKDRMREKWMTRKEKKKKERKMADWKMDGKENRMKGKCDRNREREKERMNIRKINRQVAGKVKIW